MRPVPTCSTPMFSNALFRSWLLILLGGVCFGGIFGLIVGMSEALFFEGTTASPAAKGIFFLSFVAYVGLALLLRNEDAEV
jgi:hypothetical protein